jgi:hypothetical protein
LQLLFLRLCSSFERLGFLFRLQILMTLLLAGCITIIFFLDIITLQTYLMTIFLSEFIFNGLVCIYILSIFSYLESSITVKLFMIIAGKKSAGIKRKEIRYLYAKRHIVSRRLKRFVATDIVRKKGLFYEKSPRINAFVIREAVYSVMRTLFPP